MNIIGEYMENKLPNLVLLKEIFSPHTRTTLCRQSHGYSHRPRSLF